MKSKYYILPSIIIASAFSACNGNEKDTSVSHDNLPEDVRPIALAIINDSPEEFASVVSYPIERPYPLKNVENPSQMMKYYSTIIDDSIKRKVKESPDSLWHQDGWRGWTFDNGSYFWIDEGKIYSINYVSAKENHLLDSLRNVEISTLEPSLRNGWIPMVCIVDSIDGVVFRIDTENNVDSAKLRLAGYDKIDALSGMPTLLLYGNLQTEGSMCNRLYLFHDSIGNSAEYSPDIFENDTIRVIEVTHKGKQKRYRVKPGYWLDYAERYSKADSTSHRRGSNPDAADSSVNHIPSADSSVAIHM